VGKVKRQQFFFVLALPSLYFVVVNVLAAFELLPVLHRRSALLYTGQPGASIILVSALAALALVVDWILQISSSVDPGVPILKASRHAPRIVGAALVFAVVFVGFYDRELARDLSQGIGTFLAVLLMAILVSARVVPRRGLPST
jgi:uncharacterized membrane protein YhaH (DUF805 family)